MPEMCTPPKFNTAPEKWRLEDAPFLLGRAIFRGELLNFQGVPDSIFVDRLWPSRAMLLPSVRVSQIFCGFVSMINLEDGPQEKQL